MPWKLQFGSAQVDSLNAAETETNKKKKKKKAMCIDGEKAVLDVLKRPLVYRDDLVRVLVSPPSTYTK